MSRTAVFFDTEYTTWPGAMENNWSLPGQHREIVQIATLRFDLDRCVPLAELSVLSVPRVNPVLSDYFIDLTGITNEELARDGLPYAEAHQKLLGFIGRDPAASYGSDKVMVNETLALNGQPGDFDAMNIAPWFHAHGAEMGLHAKINSGRLAETLGIEIDKIQEHNALHDVRSIAAAYAFLRDKGAPDFF